MNPQPGGFPLWDPEGFLSLSLASPAATTPSPFNGSCQRWRPPQRPVGTRSQEAPKRPAAENRPRAYPKIDQPFPPHTPSVLDLVRPRLGESPLAQPRRSPPLPEPSSVPKSFPVPPSVRAPPSRRWRHSRARRCCGEWCSRCSRRPAQCRVSTAPQLLARKHLAQPPRSRTTAN